MISPNDYANHDVRMFVAEVMEQGATPVHVSDHEWEGPVVYVSSLAEIKSAVETVFRVSGPVFEVTPKACVRRNNG